jgi:hypothetical protein
MSLKMSYAKVTKNMSAKSYNCLQSKDIENNQKIPAVTVIRFNVDSNIRLFIDDKIRDVDWSTGERIGKTCIIYEWVTQEDENESLDKIVVKIKAEYKQIKSFQGMIFPVQRKRQVFFNSKKI